MASVFPVPVPATMPKPLPARGERADLVAVLALEDGLEVEAERELDRLAGGARRRDDDDAALGVGRVAVGVGIGREMVVAGGMHAEGITRAMAPSLRSG